MTGESSRVGGSDAEYVGLSLECDAARRGTVLIARTLTEAARRWLSLSVASVEGLAQCAEGLVARQSPRRHLEPSHGPTPVSVDYQPFYCEENIHRLAGCAEVIAFPSEVIFISNRRQQVACWFQRAAPPGEPLVWDYHVVLLEAAPDGPRIWDLDTRLGAPIPAHLWVANTFQDPTWVRAAFHPRFRIAPSALFLRAFATDRSHMRSPSGHWRRPPPPWDPPGAPAMNLASWIDTHDDQGPGKLIDREGLDAHLSQLAHVRTLPP